MDALKFCRRIVLHGTSALFFLSISLQAQVPRDAVVDVTATVSMSSPYLTLHWSHRMDASITNYAVHRRSKGAFAWATLTNASPTTTSFTDVTAQQGSNFEYRVVRDYSGSPLHAYGYLNAGAAVPATEERGTLLLLVDATMSTALAPEIEQLQQDLWGDGWSVQRYDIQRMLVDPASTNAAWWSTRSNELFSVKNVIRTNYLADPAGVRAVYLLGRIPVPYSGQIAPDGHSDHVGAWPADGFYADMDGVWADSTVNYTAASDRRNWNVPGDGKFDASFYPSTLRLQLGRVDLSNMTGFPNSSMTEVELLRRYLRRAHQYRFRLEPYASVPQRGLVDDNFGWFYDEAFASVGWATAYSWFGSANVAAVDWFGTLRNEQHLFAYGCGPGSPTSSGGIGSSTDFAKLPSRAVFNVLFGSYLGDWDYGNNFMRASLAGTPDSEGLTVCWGDRPYWFFHHMALGENIGYSALLSQNNTSSQLTYGQNGNARRVHMALLGDPALRLHPVFPVQNLHAQGTNGAVVLNWEPSGDTNLLGYHIYRAVQYFGAVTSITERLATNTLTCADTSVTPGQTYTYSVRAVKLEVSAAGSYENLSQGAFVTVTSGTGSVAPFNPGMPQVTATSCAPVLLTWRDNSPDETDFEVQRRLKPTNNFETLVIVPAGTRAYSDPGPLPGGNTTYYRIRARGPGGNSGWSPEASLHTAAGQIQLNNRFFVADKISGVATVLVSRSFGQFGGTKVTVTTGNSSATNGVHFALTNNTAVWADGQSGDTQILIPLPNEGTPKLARSFSLSISAPTNGALLAFTNSCEVVINDSSASLPAGWSSTNWNNGTYFVAGQATFAEGMFGETMMGGGLGSGGNGTNDCGQFIFQPISGDGSISARVLPALAGVPGAVAGVMIREYPGPFGRFAFTTLVVGSGAKMQYRSKPYEVVTSTGNNAYSASYWVRLSRLGSNFTSEVSADGIAWTILATQQISMNESAYWGLASAGVGNDYRFVLSRFDHLSLAPHPLLLQFASATVTNYAGSGFMQFTWPAWIQGVGLHSASNLTPPIYWAPVTNALILTNGGATVPVEDLQRFYQLRGL